MKGDIFPIEVKTLKSGGTANDVIRLTDLTYPSNHLYFTNRSFTPDGERIVFLSNREGGFDLYCHKLKGSMVQQLTEGRNLDYFPFISWDGRRVFFGEGSGVWCVSFDGLEETKLLDVSELVHKQVTRVGGTFQSYDGTQLVFFYEAYDMYSLTANFGLVVLSLETGKAKIIVEGKQPVRHCQYCPLDNDLILYAHEGPWELIQTRMWLVNADGTNNRPVRKAVEGDRLGHEFWANKSKAIYFTLNHGSKSEIRLLDIETQEEKIVLDIDNCHSMIDPDERFLVVDNNRGNGDEIFLVDLSSQKVQILCRHRMSWSNYRFHPHPTFSPTGDRVVYTSDREGQHAVYLVEVPIRH